MVRFSSLTNSAILLFWFQVIPRAQFHQNRVRIAIAGQVIDRQTPVRQCPMLYGDLFGILAISRLT